MCLRDLSKDDNTNVHHKKTTGLYGNVYEFIVDYSAISNDEIHDIHAYLVRKKMV